MKAKRGVIEAKADFPARKAEVVFDDTVVTEREIEKAIEQAGFSIVKPEPSPPKKR